MTPELPDDPTEEQVAAWVELAGLAGDEEFRASMHRIADQHEADRRSGGVTGARRDAVAVVRGHAEPAIRAGIDPVSVAAEPVVAAAVAEYACITGRPDDADLRWWLLDRLETASDPRRERYQMMLSKINGWSAPESLEPVFDWFLRALRARLGPVVAQTQV
jgi:hypothetical protein